VRRIKLRLFLFPPHPTFSLWRRLSPKDKVRVFEYLQYICLLEDFARSLKQAFIPLIPAFSRWRRGFIVLWVLCAFVHSVDMLFIRYYL